MAEILMSIHGKFADMIFSGEKTIELRKSANLAKKDVDEELRTTKRALWLARAEKDFVLVSDESSFERYVNRMKAKHKNYVVKIEEKDWFEKLYVAERKCREKAEEYK